MNVNEWKIHNKNPEKIFRGAAPCEEGP